MPYVGEPFDAEYFKGSRPEGYTDYDDQFIDTWTNIADDIEAQIGPVNGLDVIEFGSAFGYLAAELESRGANVEAVDISAYAIAQAAIRFPSLSLTQADPVTEVLPWGNNSFRLLVATMLVECMNSEAEVDLLLNEGNRLLHPQGSAYILGADHDRGDGYWWKTADDWNNKVIGGRTVVAAEVGAFLPADVRIVIS
jgi:SAM-dependent methyltransferase